MIAYKNHSITRNYIYAIYYCGILIAFSLFNSSCNQKQALFKEKKAESTGIAFVNKVTENDSLNILTYPYHLNGAGVAVGDIDNDGLDDIFFVSNKKEGNKLYHNNGNFQFEDITEKAGIKGKSDWCNGVVMVDINADGWLDIYVSTVTLPSLLRSSNELYINNKNGLFTEAAAQFGLAYSCHTTQSAFFDFDNDGDLDCFLLNHAAQYADDYQLASSRKKYDPVSGNKLLRNDNGKFTDISVSAGIYGSSLGYGLGIATGDLNNDGWIDIYVSNDFKENDYCYINNGNGSFTEKSNELFAHHSRFSMGNDMADFNNDGWQDIITVDMLSPNEKTLKSSLPDDDVSQYSYKNSFGFNFQFGRNCLQENCDGKSFSDVALQQSLASTDWSWAPLFADFNNDGNKDLFITNGYKYRVNNLDFISFIQDKISSYKQEHKKYSHIELIKQIPTGEIPDYLYIQDKNSFIDVSSTAGFTKPSLSNGAAYSDLDNDGRLDLIVNRLEEPAGIYQNNLPKKNYLNISFKGERKNTFGIGACIYVYTKTGNQLYQQSAVRGFMSSVSPVIHIGLGDITIIDSLKIVWPGGKGQTLLGVKANTKIVVEEKNAVANFKRPILKKCIDETWNDITLSSGINFKHNEDDFEDLNVNPFLPHSLATQGPQTAVTDVNGDGLQDFFICGAKKQAGELWLQNINGKFSKSTQPFFEADSMYEQTSAIFFDADNDKDEDLYVTSGGNEWYGNNPLLKDRLYINDGKGNYTLSNTLPNLMENKSCAAACDFDKDGDIDLFVGGRANARMYGYMPASVLLENDVKGNFNEVTETRCEGLINAGMITGACWSDLDKDGWPDLVLAGEWMPVTVFKNKKGKFEKTVLEKSNGWWNCLYQTDLDNDGDDDFLLGNWGANSKLSASAAHPLTMYLSDWDNNGDTDPLLCVFKNNTYYNFLGKADLERRLPYLKKKYLQYAEIAGKSVEELFGKDALEKAKKFEAYTLHSAVLWNDNGKLNLQPLPSFLQTAPIFSFAPITDHNKNKQFLAGGNFYDVLPYEGRYDAMLPTLFTIRQRSIISNGNILQKGCVRHISPIRLQNKTAMLLAKNNESLTIIIK
jgi:enediyne biosynthesis protein E4